MRCKLCNNIVDHPSLNQVFCSDTCKVEYHSKKNKLKKRKKSLAYYWATKPKSFPMWICPEGHKVQLDFYPNTLENRLRKMECPICKQKAS